MDSIGRITSTGSIQPLNTGSIKSKEGQNADLSLKDSFTHSVEPALPKKPVFEEKASASSIKSLGDFSPAVQSGIASAAPGSPIFKSIAGSISKMLVSTEQEVELGKMVAEEVESTMPISKDPELNKRVTTLGEKIAANSSRDDVEYSFKVIEDDTINAFAAPGGFIYVHKGLLDHFPEDSHLTFILGHEVAHVEHRDSIERLGTEFVFSMIQSLFDKTRNNIDNKVAAAVGMLYNNRVSQRAEYKADLAAAKHMEKLGLNPREGAAALRKLDEEGGERYSILEKILSTHPPTESRAQRVEKYASKQGF